MWASTEWRRLMIADGRLRVIAFETGVRKLSYGGEYGNGRKSD
jgi:hypothetical protein